MKHKCKTLTMVFLMIVMLIPFAVMTVLASGQEKNEPVKEIELQDQYMIGTTIDLPEMEIEVDGVSYASKCILYYPSGSAYTGKKAVLNEAGKYTLEYKAIVDGKVHSISEDFVVLERLYEVYNRVSSVYYGKHEKYAQDKIGIVASIANGDKLDYNKIIDLTGKTKEDSLIKLAVTPETPGLADADNIVFTFTDLYDPDNYVTIMARKVEAVDEGATWAEVYSYFMANGAGQLPTGIEKVSSGDIVWEGTRYKLHRNDRFGASTKFSIPGTPKHPAIDESAVGSEVLSISFDYEQRRVYANDSIIIDLDDTAFFSDIRWNGFTTGECLLSISGTNYNASTMNLVIMEIDGNSDFEENRMVDLDAPQITVETENVPDAIVGKMFKIPSATAYDEIDREVPVEAIVYKSYGSASQSRVQVTDNKFMPASAVEYTIVYKASDISGNTSEFIYKVKAKVTQNEIEIALGDKEVTSAPVGSVVTVADYELTGNSGETNVVITAVSGSHEYIVEDRQFRPMYAGTYTITYEYSDYIDTKTESYTIEVTPEGESLLDTEIFLPKYLIKGAPYDTPLLSGYNFVNGQPERKQADVYVSDDGGAKRIHTASKFVSYADEYCELTYSLNGTEKTYRIPVIDVGYGAKLDISKYFVGDFTAEAGNKSIIYTDNGGNGVLEFIQPVQVFDFYLNFNVPQNLNGYKSVVVYLTDMYNPQIALKYEFIKVAEGSSLFCLNDGKQYSITADFFGGSEYFEMTYVADGMIAAPSNSFKVVVETDMYGNEWKGFTSSMAYLKIELTGKEEGAKAGIELNKLNNQPLSKIQSDIISPQISMTVTRGYKDVGQVITIVPTLAADVLDPYYTFKMHVTDPDGNYVKAKDGTLLDESADPGKQYEIVLEKFGRYEVYYESADSSGRNMIYSYIITVADIVAPEITIKNPNVSAKVNDTVLIAEIEIKDNLSTEFVVVNYVEMPDGQLVFLEGNSFIPKTPGQYSVWYYVTDEAGNISIKGYEIEIKN